MIGINERLEARRFAVRPVSVVEREHRRWMWFWALLTALCVVAAIALLDMHLRAERAAAGSRLEPPPAVPFDGYPLIGPGMTCWFKDIRKEGQIVVHDLCERFLDAYRRYHEDQ